MTRGVHGWGSALVGFCIAIGSAIANEQPASGASGALRPVSACASIKDPRPRARELFVDAGKVLQHPRGVTVAVQIQ